MLNRLRQEVLDLPRSLQETFEKGRSEYQTVVRQTRWGDGPVYLVGPGPSLAVALSGAYALESLVGWPAVHRTPQAFEAYLLPGLRPRSVLLLISPSGEEPEILSVAQRARAHDVQLLALTPKSESLLAPLTDGLLLYRRFDQQPSGLMSLVRQQAAISYLAAVAAQVLKRPQALAELVAAELHDLPKHVEWVLTQLSDVVRSVVAELSGSFSAGVAPPGDPPALEVVGAGAYHPAALLVAFLFRHLTGIRAQGWEASDFLCIRKPERDSRVLCLSGSRCRLKKVMHQAAAQARAAGARVISVTDANDRELTARSAVSVLLPVLTETVGAPLSLVFFEWVVYQMALARDPLGHGKAASSINSRAGR